ncbi:MAG: oxygen-independent coproporphyrinogen III oxidase [Steroidobacteraceae bacterium]
MTSPLNFDPELLRRYDRPGPRYTSYPTAPQFTASFGAAQLREHIRQSNAGGHALSIYAHMPFCLSPCFYCGCNRVITRDPARGERYLERLLAEVSTVAPLFDRQREVLQVHLGGGTPNFFRPNQIGRLLEALAGQFRLSSRPERDFSIELDPRTVGPHDIAELGALGFNRASLGVQDFDPQVQRAVNRIQSVEETLAVIEACRASGFRSVNVDLIYGLPLQTPEGFARTLGTVIAARPDRLAVYGYAHLPELFKPQRQLDATFLPHPETRIALLRLAIEQLSAAGYQYIGMDHFALPGDDLARAREAGGLQRNFMGYTTHADCDLLGLGVSAISHIGTSFSQNPRDLTGWEAAIDAGRLPVWRGLTLDTDDLLRADVIQRMMCQGRIDIAAIESRHGIDFAAYFAEALRELQALAEDGLLEISPAAIQATARGQLLLRLIAMCFDRYLRAARSPAAAPRYSKVV